MTIEDTEYDLDGPGMAGKTRDFGSVPELLAKLEGKVAMYERIARDAAEKAGDFERAAQAVREGSNSVIVGRTTYNLRAEATD
jgi:hypothetical protein